MKIKILVFSLCMSLSTAFCQNNNVIPVTINEKFSDFSLKTYTGENVTLSEMLGKKVMLVFVRGKVTPEIWCSICHYQYLELVEMEDIDNLREKYNLEIFFVLPYIKDSVDNWIKAFPKSLETVHGWKNPENLDSISQGAKEWMKFTQEFFPKEFDFKLEDFSLQLPVLMDEDQMVSKGLYLLKDEWGGTKVMQNVPTVYIIDEEGYVKFKYTSQYTNDRPDAKYLEKYLEKMF